MKYLAITIDFKKQYDLIFTGLFNLFKDRITFEIPLSLETEVNTVICISKRNKTSMLMKEYQDIVNN